MSTLKLTLMGSPRIVVDDQPVETDRRKALALLIYLAYQPLPQRREHLANLFWTDFDHEHAYAYLRRTLWEVNQMLGAGWIEADREQVALLRREQVWCDALIIQNTAARAAHPSPADEAALQAAAALYQGEFLEGFVLRDSPDFEAWQVEQAQALKQQHIRTLQKLIALLRQVNRFAEAVSAARQWLRLEPLDEEAYRLLMTLHSNAGQRSQALKVFQECEQILDAELGVKPEPATLRLYDQIRQAQGLVEPPASAASPAPGSNAPLPPQPQANLPSQPTRFVGRAMELLEIRRLLSDPACRLLTIVGPGGMGKTRLSIEAASGLLTIFTHGVHFISLAALTSPDLIAPEIACTLGISFSEQGMGGENSHLSQLLDYLRPRQLLLILDNFEHLVYSADLLSSLTAAAPGLKLLVSSRERLSLPEEWVFEIEGMSFPMDDRTRDLDSYSSVQLFIETARRNQPHFQLTQANQPAVARICRMLQGMPLGVELAAAWVRMLSPQEIAAEIEENIDFLATTQRGIPERHRNLRAIFKNSWALLTQEEKIAYSQLSIFQGGFTRQAAAQVCCASLGMLTSLADKSLVRRFADGRFDLHEVLHRFASEALHAHSQLLDAVQKSHAGYYLALLKAQQPALEGSQIKAAHAVLDIEFDNLRQAWIYAARFLPPAVLIEPFFVLVNYIETRGRRSEGNDLLNLLRLALIERLSATPQDADLRLLTATVFFMLGEYEIITERVGNAPPLYQQGWSLIQDLPPSKGKAIALLLCGFGAPHTGLALTAAQIERNYRETVAEVQSPEDRWLLAVTLAGHPFSDHTHPQEYQAIYADTLAALEIFTAMGSDWGKATCYDRLSYALNWGGDMPTARENALKAAAIYRELGDAYRLVSVQLHLGQLEATLGNYEQAKACYYDNLAQVTRLGRRYLVAVHQDSIGYIEGLQGNLDEAERLFNSSLAIYRALDHHHGIGMALLNLGDVAVKRGSLERGMALYHQGIGYQLEIQEPWATAIGLKKLGLATYTGGDKVLAEHLWRMALGLALQHTVISEALEILLYHARLDDARGQRCRALQTLRVIRTHPTLPQVVSADIEAELARLETVCTPAELAQIPSEKPDIYTWIEKGLQIPPVDFSQIILPELATS